MTPVYYQLHKWSKKPFIWGETDCMIVLSDWIMSVRGVDPAAEIRGTYSTKGECQRQTGFFRDPVTVVHTLLQSAGKFPMKESPDTGDIALLEIISESGRPECVGGLWLGSAWGCKGPRGTTTIHKNHVKCVAIWGVGYHA